MQLLREHLDGRKIRVDPEIFENTNYATGRTFDTIAGGASSTLSPFVAGMAATGGVGTDVGPASPSVGWSMFGTERPSNSENNASR